MSSLSKATTKKTAQHKETILYKCLNPSGNPLLKTLQENSEEFFNWFYQKEITEDTELILLLQRKIK